MNRKEDSGDKEGRWKVTFWNVAGLNNNADF